MEAPEHRIEALSSLWPVGLKSLDEAATQIGLSAARLRLLADGGYAPHYRVDGGDPLFRQTELKAWAAQNVLERVQGNILPQPIRVVVPASRLADFSKTPSAIREIEGLCDISGEARRTGIYFLCHDGELVYVGQSVDVANRVANHRSSRRDFDSVFFLPWPGDDLDRIEGALIRALRPALNGTLNGGRMRAPGNANDDQAVLAQVWHS